MRQFIEFVGYDEGEAKLEVHCYALPPGEVEELVSLLEDKGFMFENVEADSLRAVKTGNYNEVWQVVGELKKKDFTWSEEAKELEEEGEVASREELEESKNREAI